MSQNTLFTDLLGIQGWVISGAGIRLEEDGSVVVPIRFEGVGHRCSRCDEGLLFGYDKMEPRRIRDFPVWGRKCYLEVELMRVDCPNCGIVVEGLDWLERHSRQSLRYEK